MPPYILYFILGGAVKGSAQLDGVAGVCYSEGGRVTVVNCERGSDEDPDFRLISARTASPAEARAYNNAAYGRQR